MTECERAEFLESLGVDTAKLCDLCSIVASFRVDEPHQTCFALEEIKSHNDAFEQKEIEISKIRNTEIFTFEVCTTSGRYAIRSQTYAEAMQNVRNETREPVRSVRKCSK